MDNRVHFSFLMDNRVHFYNKQTVALFRKFLYQNDFFYRRNFQSIIISS